MAHNLNYTDAELARELRNAIKDTEESHRRRKSAGTITASESAGILERRRAAATRLEQLANLSPLQLEFLGLVLRITSSTAPEVPAERLPVVFITAEQTERITRLVNHPLMPRSEKTQGLLKINKLNKEEADAFILQLEQRYRELDELPVSSNVSPTSVSETSHPALTPTARNQAYSELAELLRDPRVRDDERIKAAGVIGELNESELREKINVVRNAIGKRPMPTEAASAA